MANLNNKSYNPTPEYKIMQIPKWNHITAKEFCLANLGHHIDDTSFMLIKKKEHFNIRITHPNILSFENYIRHFFFCHAIKYFDVPLRANPLNRVATCLIDFFVSVTNANKCLFISSQHRWSWQVKSRASVSPTLRSLKQWV